MKFKFSFLTAVAIALGFVSTVSFGQTSLNGSSLHEETQQIPGHSYDRLYVQLKPGYAHMNLNYINGLPPEDPDAFAVFSGLIETYGILAIERTDLRDQASLSPEYQINFLKKDDDNKAALIQALAKMPPVASVDELVQHTPPAPDRINSPLVPNDCENLDFEYGDFTNWNGFIGTCCGGGINTPGIYSGRHTIMSAMGTDANSNNEITFLAPGGGAHAVRLGNDHVNYQAEKLVKTFQVTPFNSGILYQYAVILEDPNGHPQNDKPKFEVKILDSTKTVIPGPCGYYQVTAGPATDNWKKNGRVRYKDWTTVGVDLSAYIGQTMTIEFSTEDCGWGGHFGYAYVDAACSFLEIHIEGYCPSSDSVTLTAPDGFVKYVWDPTGEQGQQITVPLPTVGDTVKVTMTNESGCDATLLHIFDPLESPNLTLVTADDTTICLQDSIELIATTDNPEDIIEWSSNPPGFVSSSLTNTVWPDTTTTYRVEVWSKYGCQGPDSVKYVTIFVNDSVRFDLGTDYTICKYDSVTLMPDTFLTGTYTWGSNPAGLISSDDSVKVSPLVNTVYDLTIESGSCSFSDTVEVDLYEPFAHNGDLIQYYCLADTIVTINAPSGYLEYVWNTGDSIQDLEILHPVDSTLYQVAVLSPYGCRDTIPYMIVERGEVPTVTTLKDTAICLGSAIQLIITGDSAGSTYSWTSDPPGFTSSKPEPIVSPTDTTYYFLEVTTSEGCIGEPGRDTVMVTIAPSPVFDLGVGTTICRDDSLVIDPGLTSGTFSWTSDPPGFVSSDSVVKVFPDQTTTYFLTVADSLGCSSSDYVNVYIANNITVSTVKFCSGATSATLTAPTGTNYNWLHNGSGNQTEVYMNPTNGEVVTVAYISPLGCEDTALFTLQQVNPPTVIVNGNNTVCEGSSTTISASNGGIGATYQWTSNPAGFISGSPTVTVSPLVNTTYIVTVTNSYGCTGPNSIDSITVTVDAKPVYDLGANVDICLGDSTTLGTGLPTGTYQWTSTPSGFTSSLAPITVKPNITTTYRLQLTSGACTVSDQVQVIVHTVPSFTHIQQQKYCDGPNFTVSAPSGFSQYLWAPGGSTSSSVSYDPALFNEGDTIIVFLETAYGCKDSARYVLQNHEITVTASVDKTHICETDQVSLSGNSVPGATYLWTSIPAGFSSSSKNPNSSPNEDTDYIVMADSAGCKAYDTLSVMVDTLVYFSLDSISTICPGDSITLDPGTTEGNHMWTSNPTGFTSTTSPITVSPNVPTEYTLRITSGLCENAHGAVVYLYTIPSPPVMDEDYCPDGSVTLTGPSGYSAYYWPITGTSGSNVTFTGTEAMDNQPIYVYLTTTDGCKDTAFVTLHKSTIDVTATASADSTCANDPVNLYATNLNGATYSWSSDPIGFTSSNRDETDAPDGPITYLVTADSASCKATDSVFVFVTTYPEVDMPDDTIICYDTELRLDATGQSGDVYEWNTGDSTAFIMVKATGSYWVKVTRNGCTTLSSASDITVRPPDGGIEIPNVFTPNSDGINDFAGLYDATELKDFHIRIFDRWGKLMFESFDNIKWDGSFDNVPVAEGVYYWIVNYTSYCEDGEKETAGFIHVMR
ncbi:MAG: gliding motility-associated C-terminal domain-containing protein [Flavobacteriales bacterium]|nr:gliding motility-associated C-terminal domain-containing protein [Flavobacteriales bacterium]